MERRINDWAILRERKRACARVPSPATISNALLDVGRDQVLRIEVGAEIRKL